MAGIDRASHRHPQDRFDTRRLADRFDGRIVRDRLTGQERGVIYPVRRNNEPGAGKRIC